MIEKIKQIAKYFPYCLTIVDVNAEGRPCVFTNQKFFINTGYSPEEAIGKNLSFLQGDLTSQDTREFMRKSFNQGDACIQDIINYKRDGTPFLNRLLMLPLKNKSKNLFYVGFQNDITKMKGLDYDNKALQSVNEGEIRHMVNNPLTVILGTMAIALEKSEGQNEIEEAAKSISDYFQRIIDYSLNIEEVSNYENFDAKNVF